MKDFLFSHPTTKRKQNPGNKHTHILTRDNHKIKAGK